MKFDPLNSDTKLITQYTLQSLIYSFNIFQPYEEIQYYDI